MKRKLSLCIIGGGLIVSVIILLVGIQYLMGPSYRVVIPGESVQSFEQGLYTVYYEYNTVVDGVYYGEVDIRGLSLKVQGEETIPMMPARSQNTYNKQGRTGVSIFSFEIENSGDYLVEGLFNETSVLVIQKMSVFAFLMYFTLGTIILLSTMTIGIYMFVKKT